MLSAYPHIDSSYSAVLAFKDAPKSSQQPTEEHLRLIRTAMRQLEDARTGGKPAGYKKVHAALASKGPGEMVCAWVVAHDSQDRVKSDNAVRKEAHRESGSKQDQASRALDHATQMRKGRTAEGKKEAADKAAAKKAEENEQRTLRNLCAQALAKFGPYLNTLAPSGADRRLLVVAHDAEGWRELKAFGDRCYEGSALYVEVCKAYDAATELEKKNKPTKKRKKRQKQKQGEPDPMPVDDTPIDDSDMRVKPVAPPVELEVDENLEAVRMFVMQYERYVAQADLAEEQSADRCNAIGAAKHQLGHAVDFLERAADSELKAASVAKLDGLLREADITAVEASLIAKREYTEHEFEWVRDFEVERICRFGKCVLDGELTRNQP